MKIIIHRYNSICEPDLIDAFRACQITVIEERIEMEQKSISASERIRSLSELILTHQASFVFSVNFFPYISEICQRLHVLYVALSVDCPVLELFSSAIRNSCNRIFLFDHTQYERFQPENPGGIFYLPLATNVDRWERTLSSLSEKDRKPYDCTISFVGSLYKEKSPLAGLALDDFHRGYADGIVEAQMQVPEYSLLEESLIPSLIEAIRQADSSFYRLPDAFENTDSFVAANYYLSMQVSSLERIRTLAQIGQEFPVDLYTRSDTSDLAHIPGIRCRGGVTTHVEMPRVFSSSKINLNITMHSIRSGLSQRIWDILGCGGFLITNYQSEIPEYFTVGEDLECYENTAELLDKIAYYLDHEDERLQIAEQGLRKVKERHTYIHRVCQMMQVLFPEAF